jgi:hypothetical protein
MKALWECSTKSLEHVVIYSRTCTGTRRYLRGVKRVRHIRMTTHPPSVSRLSRQCGHLNPIGLQEIDLVHKTNSVA